jgi:hypothetical protein
MGATELKEAAKLLRGKQLFPATIRKAQELVTASGQRINEIGIALYYSEKGDSRNASANANKAADAINRLIGG